MQWPRILLLIFRKRLLYIYILVLESIKCMQNNKPAKNLVLEVAIVWPYYKLSTTNNNVVAVIMPQRRWKGFPKLVYWQRLACGGYTESLYIYTNPFKWGHIRLTNI